MYRKKGLLLVNLGTPDAPSRKAVYRYLKQFLLDPRVIDYPWLPRNLLVRGIIVPFRAGNSAKLYRKLWTSEGSPLKVYGFRLRQMVEDRLGNDYIVSLAMRYQKPSISDALQDLLDRGVEEIVVFPLFPQYASATTGSIHAEVMRCLSKSENIPALRLIDAYPTHSKMIDVIIEKAGQHDIASYDHIIFSYHGVPQRQIRRADRFETCSFGECCDRLTEKNRLCYVAQCRATSRAIASRLDLGSDDFTVCFQSRLGPEAWTRPYTAEVLKERRAKGDQKLLVFSPAFVADCLETTIEIGEEYRDEFLEAGGVQLDLVESLNDHPRWADAIVDIVKDPKSNGSIRS